MAGSLYAIGRVVKAFGIRGEVVVEPLTSVPSRFSTLRSVLVGRTPEQTRPLGIGDVRVEARGIRIRFSEIGSRNDAETLVGLFLFVTEEQRVRLSPGSHYVEDLIGIDVVNESGEQVGVIKEVMKLPAQDVYVVEHEGKDIMIPAVREFILSIDVRKRRMVVRMIDGLREV